MENRVFGMSPYLRYLGSPGDTQDCVEAIALLLQGPSNFVSATILTHRKKNSCEHGFLLRDENGSKFVIPPGFTSGYGGAGPHGFSKALCLLESCGVEINEVELEEDVYLRLEGMVLTRTDSEEISEIRPRTAGIHADYIFEDDWKRLDDGRAWRQQKTILPLALIEPPIFDIALGFFGNPDHALLLAYRRLEDAVREKSGLDGSSAQLMSDAFQGDKSAMHWEGIDSSEQKGRAQLFVGAFMAFRNRRAHREPREKSASSGEIAEFLMLNLLFSLLGSSVLRKPNG